MSTHLIRMLERRHVITTDPAEASECCGLERDEDGFCIHRPNHPIYVQSQCPACGGAA